MGATERTARRARQARLANRARQARQAAKAYRARQEMRVLLGRLVHRDPWERRDLLAQAARPGRPAPRETPGRRPKPARKATQVRS